jgi:hypothetical protein
MAYTDTTPRDSEIGHARQEAEALRTRDAQIQAKVNQAHREAFREKFPNQIEHCMRLIAERLQLGLRKDTDMQINDCSAKDLSLALWNLYRIRNDLDTPKE